MEGLSTERDLVSSKLTKISLELYYKFVEREANLLV